MLPRHKLLTSLEQGVDGQPTIACIDALPAEGGIVCGLFAVQQHTAAGEYTLESNGVPVARVTLPTEAVARQFDVWKANETLEVIEWLTAS